MKDLLGATAVRAARYLQDIETRRVSPSPEAIARLDALDVALPANGVSPERVLEELDTIGSPATMAMPGARFFGFVIGGSLPQRSPPIGWRRRGIRTRASTTRHPARRCSRRWRSSGCSTCSVFPRRAPAHSSRVRRWRT